jgi:hypothetical protein
MLQLLFQKFQSFIYAFLHLSFDEKAILSKIKLNFERLKIKRCKVNSFNKQTEGISKIMKMCFDAQTIVDSFFCQKQNKTKNKIKKQKSIQNKETSFWTRPHVSVGLGFTVKVLLFFSCFFNFKN